MKNFTEFEKEKENLMQKEADMSAFGKFVDAIVEYTGRKQIAQDTGAKDVLMSKYSSVYSLFDDADSLCRFTRNLKEQCPLENMDDCTLAEVADSAICAVILIRRTALRVEWLKEYSALTGINDKWLSQLEKLKDC